MASLASRLLGRRHLGYFAAADGRAASLGDTWLVMSGENVDIVRQALEAHESEGMEAALRFFAADVVWYPTDRWLESNAYRGHEGMRAVEAEWTVNFDDWRWSVHDIRDAGERVVALVEMTGCVKGSGIEMHRPLGLVASNIQDGTMGTIRAYPSWEEALKAAGLDR